MSVTWMQLVERCENSLGWLPEPYPEDQPEWRWRQVEAGKLKRAAAKQGLAPDDLAWVIDWCRRRKETLRSPVGLVWLADKALNDRAELELAESDVDEQLREALADERSRPATPEGATWQQRLLRVMGQPNAAEVLEEWRAERA